jgi:hypothetical protein
MTTAPAERMQSRVRIPSLLPFSAEWLARPQWVVVAAPFLVALEIVQAFKTY